MDKFYFDYAATTPLDSRVFQKMKPFWGEDFGNPSNLYEAGRIASQAIKEAQHKIVKVLNCDPGEFVFTSGATEADNLAIIGIAEANKDLGNKIIISEIEHKSVLSICGALERRGFKITKIPVDVSGIIDLKIFQKELDKKTILVSFTYAESETGTIEPIKEITEIIKNFRRKQKQEFPYFHIDASQAAGLLDLDVKKLGADLMTLSGHKIYGPKGIGGLFIRRGIKIKPIILGAGQQEQARSGTENVPAIVGFGEALFLVQKEKNKEAKRLKRLRDKFEKGVFKNIPKVILNGHPQKRLPNFSNISILDVEGEALLLYLDQKGISVSTGSACNSLSLEPSHVLFAMGRPYEFIHGSLRFSMGKYTDESSINYALKNLSLIASKLRRISPLNLNINSKRSINLPKAFLGQQTPHFLRKKK